MFRKNQFFNNNFTFLSVMHQYLEYNLRILANFPVKTQKSLDFAYTFSKNYFFFLEFLIKIILFTLKTYFFITKDAKSFVKISFLVTFLDF